MNDPAILSILTHAAERHTAHLTPDQACDMLVACLLTDGWLCDEAGLVFVDALVGRVLGEGETPPPGSRARAGT